MKTVYLAITALALLLPAQALAGGSSQSAAAVCRSQQAQLGTATFHATYGSFGRCVAHQQVVQAQARQEALDQCKTERDDAGFALAHGGKTFDQYYGGTSHGKNALQACVAAKLPALIAAASQRTMNAAQLCRAQRTAMGAQGLRAPLRRRPAPRQRLRALRLRGSSGPPRPTRTTPRRPARRAVRPDLPGQPRRQDVRRVVRPQCRQERRLRELRLGEGAGSRRRAPAATLNAAQSCKGERATSPAAFRGK